MKLSEILAVWMSKVKYKKDISSKSEMSFFDHLETLRWHLIRACIVILILTAIAFSKSEWLFDRVILGPKHSDFWTYKIMCQLAHYFRLGSGYCLTEIKFDIINTELSGQFTLQINSSLMIGLVVGFPYLLFEIWRFVRPALTLQERRAASGFVFFASLLFAVGILFGYFIIAPYSIRFLAGFKVSEVISNEITIDSYLSSVLTLTVVTGLVFELPMVALIFSKLGLLTSTFMRSSRRYAIVLMLFVAAIVTPTPDVQTMLIVTVPLMILYEISIVVTRRVENKNRKALI